MNVAQRKYADELRTIIELRVRLLEKDIGQEKLRNITRALDNMSLRDLRFLNGVQSDLADEILRIAT
jgi:hypothetical protein